MIIPVTVTQSNINSGIRKDALACPINMALRGVFPNIILKVCSEGIFAVTNDKPYYRTIHKFSDNMTQWIRDFDTGKKVYPVTFDMEIAEGIAGEWGYKGAK